jgi:hypothetical protein
MEAKQTIQKNRTYSFRKEVRVLEDSKSHGVLKQLVEFYMYDFLS